jgi:hypothetical protein
MYNILHRASKSYKSWFFTGICIACFTLQGCQQHIDGFLKPEGFLKPKDFLNTPSIIDPSRQYGHLKTEVLIVSATADIFLTGADEGVVIEYPVDECSDRVPDNSPVEALENVIVGGETLDIHATGKARHLPLRSVVYGPQGWTQSGLWVKTEPILNVYEYEGLIGSLVGLFDNEKTPFLIGRHVQIKAPRGAKILYLAMLDYPGASSDNDGEYTVTIDVIRR